MSSIIAGAAAPEEPVGDPRGAGQAGADFVVLQGSGIECTVGNNKAAREHQAGYNGLFALRARGSARNAFVPAYAGVNLE